MNIRFQGSQTPHAVPDSAKVVFTLKEIRKYFKLLSFLRFLSYLFLFSFVVFMILLPVSVRMSWMAARVTGYYSLSITHFYYVLPFFLRLGQIHRTFSGFRTSYSFVSKQGEWKENIVQSKKRWSFFFLIANISSGIYTYIYIYT